MVSRGITQLVWDAPDEPASWQAGEHARHKEGGREPLQALVVVLAVGVVLHACPVVCCLGLCLSQDLWEELLQEPLARAAPGQ